MLVGLWLPWEKKLGIAGQEYNEKIEEGEIERAGSTLIASVFSTSISPRAILRSISSIITALLRPLTKTLLFVSREV